MDRSKTSELTSANRQVLETGAELYRKWGCGTCHGDDAGGSPKGPALRGLAQYWDKKNLIEYLQNPKDVRSRNDRLGELSKRYFPISMPAIAGLTDQELTRLTDYLLTIREVQR
jgi:cytochrome c553